jgi:hypothetical protein
MNTRDKTIMHKVNSETLKGTNMILVSYYKYRALQTLFVISLIIMMIISFTVGVYAVSPEFVKDKFLTIFLKIEISEQSFNLLTDYIDSKLNQINSIPISP